MNIKYTASPTMFYSGLLTNTETHSTQRQPLELTSAIECSTVFEFNEIEPQQPLSTPINNTLELPTFDLTELCPNTPSCSEPADQNTGSGSSSRDSNSTQTDDDKVNVVLPSKVLLSKIRASYVCPHCGQTFPSKLQHRRCNQQHIYSSSPQINVCRHCHSRFTLPKDLKRHYATNACKHIPKIAKIALFSCMCGNKYARKDSLLRHLQNPGSRARGSIHQSLQLT